MEERKTNIYLPSEANIRVADEQDLETLERGKEEPLVDIYIPSDPDEDTIFPLEGGGVTKARQININGVPYMIPVDTYFKVPKFVRDHWDRCLAAKHKAPRVRPNVMVNLSQQH